ncbi:CubicO group peptidase (beta-lactamase class C family) [Stakelama sediminis]|uniref:CubicO group peptidase (Beta-lactamase class C family) n=1 Tax=Stakelama sediminis TaxID=463200 RepID=A0A840YXY8_9SPHN|nr:serine hydrolase [Stakelama sediminis]MBB5718399.1 CubicO group peptidase (beta-lactamase class C family) [Stakelama sediminis]
MTRKSFLAALIALTPLAMAHADTPRALPFRAAVQGCGDVDVARVQPLLDGLFTQTPETRGVLLLVNGCPAYKAYEQGYSDANRMISWSMAKTVTAMLVGALVADGKLDPNAPAPIAEWHRPGDPRARITLADLLHMASGLRHIEVGDPIEKSDTNQVLFVTGTQDMAARAIAQPLVHPPGTHFEYSSLTTIILSEIITRTLTDSHDPRVRAQAYRQFAQSRLFGPVGVKSAFLEFDGAGTQIGGSLIYMTLDDWGRMGTLLLKGQSRDGKQVVAPRWLAFMKRPSEAYAGYGGQTWLNHQPKGQEPGLFTSKGPRNAVGMKGHLGQFVMAGSGTAPDGTARSIVLVRLGHTDEGKMQPILSRMGDVFDALLKAD